MGPRHAPGAVHGVPGGADRPRDARRRPFQRRAGRTGGVSGDPAHSRRPVARHRVGVAWHWVSVARSRRSVSRHRLRISRRRVPGSGLPFSRRSVRIPVACARGRRPARGAPPAVCVRVWAARRSAAAGDARHVGRQQQGLPAAGAAPRAVLAVLLHG